MVFQLSVDLDIENGSAAHYSTFVNALRSLAKNARKRYFALHCLSTLSHLSASYYVTAAPQCPFPDAKIGNALDNAFFDAVYVQFCKCYIRNLHVEFDPALTRCSADNNFCEVSVPTVGATGSSSKSRC